MLYAVGLRTGEWNIEQKGGLRERMEMDQLYGWIAYNNLDPFTSDRDDWRHAQTTAAIYNVNILEKSNRLSAKDFMMESIEERLEREEREAEMDMSAESAANAWGMYMSHLDKVGTPVSEKVYKG